MASHSQGQALYLLYCGQPPQFDPADLTAIAYWQGYQGFENYYRRLSLAWWAYRAGRHNRLAEQPKARKTA
jgi:hypothetical protein